jgi:CelD/BcsL family acetyltransferase involved in cellulose biosynthesis
MNIQVPNDTTAEERLEIVVSAGRLAEVEGAWMHLWHRSEGLIFQSHGWVSAWWATVADRDQRALRIGLVWKRDGLVAVLPLAIGRRKGLRFLEWAASSYTDYGDMLVAPECSDAALQGLWTKISASGGFDLVYLNRILPDAAVRKLLGQATSGGVNVRPNHREEVSYRVAGGWESGAAWLASQSKKTRKNYRRSIKLMEESGELKFRMLSDDEPLQPVLERLSELKRQWLAQHTRESDLFDEGANVLAGLVDALARTGVLRIFVLECNGVLIAVSINFVQRGTMMAFVTTYDPEFSRASPGVVLMIDYIQWSIDHGLKMVDFLCGAEPFKHKFATQGVTLQSVLGTRTLKGSLVYFGDRIRQKLHGMRDRRQAASSPVENDDDADA